MARRVKAEPDRPFGLQAAGERAIVDDLGPDGGDPARPLQHPALDQHAATGGGGELVLLLRDPREGIEHLEEEDEGRDEETLRPTPAGQLRHQRDQHVAFALGARDQRPKVVGSMADIRIGQQEVVRRLPRRRVLDALMLSPELAGPSRGQSRSAQDLEALAGAQGSGGLQGSRGRAVFAAVVHQHDAERAWIILLQQAFERLGDDVRLVAGGHDGRHARPAGGLGRSFPIIALARQPKSATTGQQVEPDRQRKNGQGHSETHVR